MDSILTETELDVLQRFAQGGEIKHVAVLMQISVHTVTKHKTNIKDKLGADTFCHAVSIAYEIGLFHKDKEVQQTREIALELFKTIKEILTTRKVTEDKHKRRHFKIEHWDYTVIESTLEKAKFLNPKS